ncbi:patatin-like phospholipase family protein [Pseudoduganella dura]|nr:patatin-like phospholipase family protein [Pseudoduganella dura]GGY08847.1 patatin [Pseudoduganella dura]
MSDSDSHPLNPNGMRVVLVLQGGGALGAYQAGVYEALHEHGLAPDWVVGTSIGAINAALLAGNRQEDRLRRIREFWQRMSQRDPYDPKWMTAAQRRQNIRLSTLHAMISGVRGFFRPRTFNPFAFGMSVPAEQASYYDTDELTATLEELVDFDVLNSPEGMRLTVNALRVANGDLVSFDSLDPGRITADHIRASGALPPGFPAVRIDGELYWDGGLYSNTPLQTVLDDTRRPVDTLCFMVDLWSAQGPEPDTLEEVQTRQKDVTFASRSQRHLDDYVKVRRLQQKLRELYASMPPQQHTAQHARDLADLGCDTTLHVVRIPYAGHDWHMPLKDINFSQGSVQWRWSQGYADAQRAIGAAGWLAFVSEDTPLVVHELPPLPDSPATGAVQLPLGAKEPAR